MKTQNKHYLPGIIASALFLGIGATAGQPLEAVKPSGNRVVAASPRYLEEHPELARSAPKVGASEAKAARVNAQLEHTLTNRALAASPRFLEEHPELLRVQPAGEDAAVREARTQARNGEVARNRALVTSPRVSEDFPELSPRSGVINTGRTFQVAPAK